jgi:N-formylglutamate amidohydrolase
MRDGIDTMGGAGRVPPFRELRPTGRPLPIVLSSPHSGRVYPPDLMNALRIDPGELRCLDDGPVDSLVAPCVEAGAAVITATYARAFVDLNRNSAELDPDLLTAPMSLPDLRLSAKVRAGLGVVPSRIGGRAIYHRRLDLEEVQSRLIRGYQPYHDRLASLLGEARHRLGVAILLDCHSMPSEAAGQRAAAPVDVALGDRFGRSCGTAFMDVAAELLAARGLLVARNQPYAGGFITEHYGRPLEGWHALQVEFRRQLFMDESSGLAHAGAARLQALLMELVGVLAEVVSATAVSPAA